MAAINTTQALVRAKMLVDDLYTTAETGHLIVPGVINAYVDLALDIETARAKFHAKIVKSIAQ